jgi:hypothetical protein
MPIAAGFGRRALKIKEYPAETVFGSPVASRLRIYFERAFAQAQGILGG